MFIGNIFKRMGYVGESVSVTAGPYTMAGNIGMVLADGTAAAFSVLLPATPVDKQRSTVKKTDASVNAITMDGNTRTIDGLATAVILHQNELIEVEYNASEDAWFIVGVM